MRFGPVRDATGGVPPGGGDRHHHSCHCDTATGGGRPPQCALAPCGALPPAQAATQPRDTAMHTNPVTVASTSASSGSRSLKIHLHPPRRHVASRLAGQAATDACWCGVNDPRHVASFESGAMKIA